MFFNSFYIIWNRVFALAGVAFVFFHCIISGAAAQSVRILSTNDGLPQSFISGLVQDSAGFIWIGTRNGLARYDGIECKVFQHNVHDTTTLASNVIIWINKDTQNHLWIEFESGEIDEMDPVNEKITHFITGNSSRNLQIKFVRKGWLVDTDGDFWSILKGNGLDYYNPRTKYNRHYTRIDDGLPSDTLRSLLMDGGSLWILSQNGISKLDKKSKQFTHYTTPVLQDFNNIFDAEGEVVDLHKRKNGELMWGDRQRLFFFNPHDKFFRTVPLAGHPWYGIRWIRTGPDSLDYFETAGEVFRYDDAHGLSPISRTKMSNLGDARSFLVDRSGLVWVGTNAAGIHQVDLVTPFFQSYSYKFSFLEDLLNQEMGLSVERLFNWTPGDSKFSFSGYHFRSAYDKKGHLWMALKETVVMYDTVSKKIEILPRVPVSNGKVQAGIGIKGITFNEAGDPMVICYNGNILTYDFAKKTWQPFIDPLILRKSFGADLLPQDVFNDGTTLWITTANDGLLYTDIHSGKTQQVKENDLPGSLPTNQLLGLKADPNQQDLLWIGSYQGLICLNKKTLKCEIYSLNEGLPDNTIYSMQADRLGNLWLSTNKGLCRFHPVTHRARVFRTPYGLPGDEFNRFHHFELPDGRLAFGGTTGWTVFDPVSIKNDDFQPNVSLTGIKINNQDVTQFQVNSILPAPLNSLDVLSLPYEKNTLTIEFAGLQFNQPQDLMYRYQLAGYDNNWVIAGHSHTASYTRIPPGNYTLFVNSSNTTGKWSRAVKSIRLQITPPWWSTMMAYLCYGIILIGLTWVFIRFRINRVLLRQEMALNEREARQLKELDEMKTHFFSNITHEFRTPLTLIMGPAEQLKSVHADDPQQLRLADSIVKNAGQLLGLINRLMDLSKLEAKALKLREQRGNPAATIGSVVYSFENEAIAKQVRLVFDQQTGVTDCWFYPHALEHIVYNLLSNALKFTPESGQIEITLSLENEELLLEVADTGIGIEESRLPFIFDRFYQAGNTSLLSDEKQHEGTGIGLALVKEIVDQLGGSIEVQSRVVSQGTLLRGTVFTLSLPYRLPGEEDQLADLPDEKNLPGEATEEQEKLPSVLLVEDNQELARFIEGTLDPQYLVQHVQNGAIGFEAALANMPDLIVSDVLMPVMDGFTMCSKLKNDIRTSHIPLILLTAKASQDSLIEGLSKGADDYLTKPFHPSELLLRIHNLIARQQKLREKIRVELSLPGIPQQKEVVEDVFLVKLYARLDEHLDDSLFGVDQISGEMNMSRSSLHRKLKTITGLSTSEVVRNYRLKKATILLRSGHNSSDTAYMAGFGSPAYFTRCFREVYGMTPGEYIKQE